MFGASCNMSRITVPPNRRTTVVNSSSMLIGSGILIVNYAPFLQALLLPLLLPLHRRLRLRRGLRLRRFRFAVGGLFRQPHLAQLHRALAHGAAGGLVFRRRRLAVARLVGLALETRLGFRLGFFGWVVAHGAPWPRSSGRVTQLLAANFNHAARSRCPRLVFPSLILPPALPCASPR